MKFIGLDPIQLQILAYVGLAMLLGAAIGRSVRSKISRPACAPTCW